MLGGGQSHRPVNATRGLCRSNNSTGNNMEEDFIAHVFLSDNILKII